MKIVIMPKLFQTCMKLFRSPLTSIVFFPHTMEINGEQQQCLVIYILQNISFCVQQNKETHTDLEQLESE